MQSEAMGGSDRQRPAVTPSGGESVALASLGGVELESIAFIHDEPFLTIVYEDGEFVGELVRHSGDRDLEWAKEVGLGYGLILDGVRMGDDGGYMGLRFREIGGYDI